VFAWRRSPEGWFTDFKTSTILPRGCRFSPEPESLRSDKNNKAVIVPSFQNREKTTGNLYFVLKKSFLPFLHCIFSKEQYIMVYIKFYRT